MKRPTLFRTARKAARDLLIIAVSAALLALAENAGDFGIPDSVIPIVSAAALFGYRFVRDWGKVRSD